MADVKICEVGPRDGLQNMSYPLGVPWRTQLIDGLSEAGLNYIEIGSYGNGRRVPQMEGTDRVAERITRRHGVDYGALVFNERGYETARQTNMPVIAVCRSANPEHNAANFGVDIKGTKEKLRPVFGLAKDDRRRVRVYLSTGFGYTTPHDTPVKDVVNLLKWSSESGACEISFADTTGLSTPETIKERLRAISGDAPLDKLALHFHTEHGDKMQRRVDAGYEAGVRIFDASILGLGGCPTEKEPRGNVDTKGLVSYFEKNGIKTGVDIEKLEEAERKLSEHGLVLMAY